ncbi:MAG: response regulator [Gorillibacterium sp.]|nr:response regulator [Gorillibacterium sp.]
MYNVLVVDDEELITEGMGMLIDWQRYGFRIMATAGDGQTALEIIKSQSIDLLITDIRMPEMDGLQLIEAVRDAGIHLRIVILSGYGDFLYAKKAIQFGVTSYLLKPVEVEELIECLSELGRELDQETAKIFDERQTQNMVRDKVLFDYASGSMNVGDLPKHSDKFGVILQTQQVQSALIEMTHFHQLVREHMYDAMLYRYGLRNIAEETIQQPGFGYVYEEADGMIGIIFLGAKSTWAEKLSMLTSVNIAAKKWLKQEVVIGLGGVVATQQVKLSRKQALYALEDKFKGSEPIRLYEQMQVPDSLVWDVHWDSDTLMLRLEEGDLAKLDEQVSEFIQEVNERRLPVAVIKGTIFSLFSKIGRLIKRYEDDAAPFVAELEREFQACLDRGEPTFSEWFSESMRRTGKYIVVSAKKKEPHVIHAILEFIGNHYADNLSLKQIAGLYFINTAYLGQLFKQKTGQTFNDYLNKTRISSIKKALIQNQYAGMESINRAGFKNVEHFYKQFKRYEGMAFSEYKERVHNLKEEEIK